MLCRYPSSTKQRTTALKSRSNGKSVETENKKMDVSKFHFWKFSEPITNEHEIECPLCHEWSPVTAAWGREMMRCLGCGQAFMSLGCPACGEQVGHHYPPFNTKRMGDPVPVTEEEPGLPRWKKPSGVKKKRP